MSGINDYDEFYDQLDEDEDWEDDYEYEFEEPMAHCTECGDYLPDAVRDCICTDCQRELDGWYDDELEDEDT